MDEFDYVIVGAEPAAQVLACRLSENSATTVLLLDDAADGPASAMPWRARRPTSALPMESEPEAGCDGRRMALSRDGGALPAHRVVDLRCHPADYDRWLRNGCEGWGGNDVLPYFRRAAASWRGEDAYHREVRPPLPNAVGTGLPDVVRQTLRAAAIAIDEPSAAADGGALEFDADPASIAEVYLRPAARRFNLARQRDARVVRVDIDQRTATGVTYRRGDAMHTVAARREVILCGGSFGSPRLLLLSGIGPAAELAALGIVPVLDLAGVGRRLREQIVLRALHPLNAATASEMFSSARPRRRHVSPFRPGETVEIATALRLRSRPNLERPDLELRVTAPAAAGQPAVELALGLGALESLGDVRLASIDPLAPPRVRLNLLAADADRAAARAAVGLLREIAGTPPLRDLIGRETRPGPDVVSDDAVDAFVRRTAEIAHRAVGSCAMGTSPMAVVDRALRVPGVAGLRVVDASVMPVMPCGDSCGPTIMIAERAADLIAGRPVLQPAEADPPAPRLGAYVA